MYKRLGSIIIALLETVERYPEELKQLGLTQSDIRTAITVIQVILMATRPTLLVDGREVLLTDEV